jgi:hypothetical protein
MVGRILKGLAVAASIGMAIGFGGKRRTQATSMNDTSETILAMEPLLDRLDRIEARMSAVEVRPTANIEALQAHVERRLAEVAQEVPAIIESLIGPHVDDVRARLHAEMRESVQATLTSFEQTLDDKISLRIATLEKALMDQSAIVTTLGRRAIETEENFQRLISAVERLCERKERAALDLPFERRLSEAFQRQPAPSAIPLDIGFRPRIIPAPSDFVPPVILLTGAFV